jgi:hypothetical protein
MLHAQIPNGALPACAGRKVFFSEEKKQKTFVSFWLVSD